MRDIFGPYRDMTLEDIRVTDDYMQDALDQVTTYIANLDDNRAKGHGLTLLGPAGVGKTMLSCLVLKEAKARNYRIEAIEFTALVELVKKQYTLASFGKNGNEEAQDEWYRIEEHVRRIKGGAKRTAADWVLLDDIGREYESGSGWSANQLFDLTRFRYNRGLPFLLTSNCGEDQLDQRYTEGLVSFLHEATEVIYIGSEDYRTREERSAGD
jgi:DNA replication protein DnaC